MSLAVGAHVGPYEVIAPIGAGGMGVVWRARDTKLNRDVALKVLPDAFASDTERLARFTREAQTLASLNHPNIAHIHGLETGQVGRAGQGGQAGTDFPFLVMELVEGEELSQRIARGAIPLEEALPIAKQIADALEAAHEHGIIHRDLKPANIKVRGDGVVKVLDFGLAKAIEGAGPSTSLRAGEAGRENQASSNGGTQPVWSRDGKELFFIDATPAVMVAAVRSTPPFSPSTPTRLFDAQNYFLNEGQGRPYDVSLDGRRFLMIKETTDPSRQPTVVAVLNWFEELKRLVPAQ